MRAPESMWNSNTWQELLLIIDGFLFAGTVMPLYMLHFYMSISEDWLQRFWQLILLRRLLCCSECRNSVPSCGTWKFISQFVRIYHWIQSWVKLIISPTSFLTSVLPTVSFNLCLYHPRDFLKCLRFSNWNLLYISGAWDMVCTTHCSWSYYIDNVE
jgi:hypothetical protein